MEREPPSLAQHMRNDAELRYDSVIPIEIRAAISAQERIESDRRAMRDMTQGERLRFLAAREFQLAKSCFRTLVRMARSRTVSPRSRAWFALRETARRDAEIHAECWQDLRRREHRLQRRAAGSGDPGWI